MFVSFSFTLTPHWTDRLVLWAASSPAGPSSPTLGSEASSEPPRSKGHAPVRPPARLLAGRQSCTFLKGRSGTRPAGPGLGSLLLSPTWVLKCTSRVNRIVQCEHNVDKGFSLNFETRRIGKEIHETPEACVLEQQNIHRRDYIINDSRLATFLVLIKLKLIRSTNTTTTKKKHLIFNNTFYSIKDSFFSNCTLECKDSPSVILLKMLNLVIFNPTSTQPLLN